jgi:hypothetical protein
MYETINIQIPVPAKQQQKICTKQDCGYSIVIVGSVFVAILIGLILFFAS